MGILNIDVVIVSLPRRDVAVVMTAQPEFDAFLRRGPANDDPVQGLADLRYKILIDGIPSNSDGMVCSPFDVHYDPRSVQVIDNTTSPNFESISGSYF